VDPLLYDAHSHLADARFDPLRERIEADLETVGLRACVVNGTSPDDWPAVLALARRDARVIPAVGLHPWKVNGAPPDWRERFLECLESGARAVGEIGLDRWIKDDDPARQEDAFRWQLAQAAARDLPVSIHCLKAFGPLLAALRETALPRRGVHLHACNGSADAVAELEPFGAYFSFNGGQLKPGHKKVREAVRATPPDRLLIETDAPDFLPPEELREFELPDDASGRPLAHPANLRRTYAAVADLRGVSAEELATQVAGNFQRFFLD
jgi:TatD DNase family protein